MHTHLFSKKMFATRRITYLKWVLTLCASFIQLRCMGRKFYHNQAWISLCRIIFNTLYNQFYSYNYMYILNYKSETSLVIVDTENLHTNIKLNEFCFKVCSNVIELILIQMWQLWVENVHGTNVRMPNIDIGMD